MLPGEPGRLLLANRTERWGGVRFGLGSSLNGCSQKFLDVAGRLHFPMAEILIAGQRAAPDGLFQSASRPSRKHGQRLAHRITWSWVRLPSTQAVFMPKGLHCSARN